MSPSSSTGRKDPIRHQRYAFIERPVVRMCDPCRQKRRPCDGRRPCSHCVETHTGCLYTVVPEHPQSVITTSSARRLSSGSACETCRRRKTKCDGCQPCAYCATNGIECVSNFERRKRTTSDNEAMERIEDRLRRIEKLMNYFAPSPLSQSTNAAYHITSSSTPPPLSSMQHRQQQQQAMAPPRAISLPPNHMVRQQRHSVQGISVDKERAELRFIHGSPPPHATTARHPRFGTPPVHSPEGDQPSMTNHGLSPSASPLPSPSPQTAGSSQPLTSSMLHLSLSPSSSTSSSSITNNIGRFPPQQSASTPLSPPVQHRHAWPPSPPPSLLVQANRQMDTIAQAPSPPESSRSTSSSGEWKTPSSIPSLMEQLSKRTFPVACQNVAQYPIYRLPPSPQHTSSSPLSDH